MQVIAIVRQTRRGSIQDSLTVTARGFLAPETTV
jgi:hypothetical protein